MFLHDFFKPFNLILRSDVYKRQVFEFDASAIAGTTVVAFESMEYKGIEVAVHADIEDENQTVYIPDVHTTATATDTELSLIHI